MVVALLDLLALGADPTLILSRRHRFRGSHLIRWVGLPA